MTGFKFKKRFGQNFLRNDAIIEKIVTSISPTVDDLIIEIGPGSGALTKRLKTYGSILLAFEIDEDTKDYLIPLEDEKTKIIYGDFLKTDIKKEIMSYSYANLYIIGNLPYYITTPILEHIVESQVEPKSITVMVQKEVGERFMARPKHKEYGYMTVYLNYYFDIQKIVDVPKKDFFPSPKVDSTVLKLSKKDRPFIDESRFQTVVKKAFQFKRKTIANNLFSYDKKVLEEVLNKHGYTLQNRAEEIDLETYIDLSKNL